MGLSLKDEKKKGSVGNELGKNDQSLVKLAWLTLPSLEDKDPLPDSRGSAIDRLFGLESLQRLSCLGLVYQENCYLK